MSLRKYEEVAERVRAQIADGTLQPGQPAPSGADLSRATGYSTLTCRKAVRTLIRDGVLVPGTSPSARPRVPSHAAPGQPNRGDAARALSGSLRVLRRAASLTQPQFAEIVGVSVTTIGHAETGRLWQSRRFWEHADKAFSADGELLALHDAYRAERTTPAGQVEPTPEDSKPETDITSPVSLAASGALASVTITWADGAMTTVYPPVMGDTRLAEQ